VSAGHAVRSRASREGGKILVCFAVKQEAAPFRKRLGTQPRTEILITGMGGLNAERAIREALAGRASHATSSEAGRSGKRPYEMVLSCGFAGGLDSRLKTGTVLFDADAYPVIVSRLEAAGAIKGRFLFSERVATTVSEKRALRQQSGADAVEMESLALSAICRHRGIPAATVRVILDTAEDDLALDFNALMTPDQELSYARLLWALARSPGKICGLLKLQKQSRTAAESLAAVLCSFVTKAA
jgi:adenosylhomocysteine nucleosidase